MFNQFQNYKLIPNTNNPSMVRAVGNCVLTGKEYSTKEFSIDAYDHYKKDGAMIQDALHMLSVDDREFILSGISPEGWDQMKLQDIEEEIDSEFL